MDKMTRELDPYSADRKHKLESPSFRNEGEHRPLQNGDSQGNRSTQKRWVELQINWLIVLLTYSTNGQWLISLEIIQENTGPRKLCKEVQGLHLALGETRAARAMGMRLLGEASMVTIARKGS